jgi:hypothetical protein
MMKAGQDLRFPLELAAQLAQCFRAKPRLRDHFLDGDRKVEVGIPGPIHGRHATSTQLGIDAITILQYFADGQGHLVFSYH